MRRLGLLHTALLVLLGVGATYGAAPSAPSYQGIESAIGKIRADWAKPGAAQQPNSPGWNALFDALLADLKNHSTTQVDRDRLISLNRIYQVSTALAAVNWAPATEMREELREWLRPRVRLSWAERRLVDHLNGMPVSSAPNVADNRKKWVKFVDADLSKALKQYDAATTVAQKSAGLKAVNSALTALQTRNAATPWDPSRELEAALNDLYNQRNLDISVDVNTLSPVINTWLVTSGPIERKGYISQVTAGPKTGFGLANCDDGIAFFNSQLMSSYTPITDFQQQVQNNPQGKRAAKLYQFNAVSTDAAEITIMAVIRSTGLSLYPSYKHNVNADITTSKQAGGGFGRAVASLVGFNQKKITEKAYDNAIGPIRSNVEVEAMEEGLERTSAEAANRNVALRQILIGGNRATYQNVMIEQLLLQSRPENAIIGGKIEYVNAKGQVGADAPQPTKFAVPDPGVSADVHLSSIMANFAAGYLQSPVAVDVNNLMVVTQKIPPDAPPASGVRLVKNADYPTFLKEIVAAQAANDPKVLAIRVKKPTKDLEFGVDVKGNLVALVNDFQIEVPAPPSAAKGGLTGPPAKVFRIVSPQAEFTIALKVEAKSEKEPLRLTGRIEGFDPGFQAKVYSIDDDESKATAMTAFTASFVLGVIRTKLQGQPIDVPLSNLQLRGFAIKSVSPLDPTGWLRVNLERTSDSPAAGIQ